MDRLKKMAIPKHNRNDSAPADPRKETGPSMSNQDKQDNLWQKLAKAIHHLPDNDPQHQQLYQLTKKIQWRKKNIKSIQS